MIEVSFTKHAEDMLQERNFAREEIISIISNPDWLGNDESDVKIWHAFKRIGEKVLRVVIKGRKEPYIVITMFYDRRLRDQK